MTEDVVTRTEVHACNRRGVKNCGSTTSGDARANVDLHPETWSQVTCIACLATKKG